ncbi:hypothetical protein [Aeromonas dhakensis]|uniref:hypothetical protein n=1 Tax=Aeromonas dhakensis TaxID=196024 RepID=UPI0023791F3E|nr:hypothetical protein [Aeromonas dhakensis]MDD9211033.1 hypothetical protein [Aeromonas dhakensis]
MSNEIVMSIFTGLLVLIGLAQVLILINQRRQNQLVLLQEYRQRWFEFRKQWSVVIFIGRNEGEYYQVASREVLTELTNLVENSSSHEPTVWALESIRCVCNTLSDICIRILQGQLEVRDVYPLFGTELLRQSLPLRVLLDVYYKNNFDSHEGRKHSSIREELQDWLIYHDGVRRRCLILIDLLWAEAVRLEDLSPSDIKKAAEAKIKSGVKSKKRLVNELNKINGKTCILKELKLAAHLKHSEFSKFPWQRGINAAELDKRNETWIKHILRE